MSSYNARRAKELKTAALRGRSETAISQLGLLVKEDPSQFTSIVTVVSHYVARNPPPSPTPETRQSSVEPEDDPAFRLMIASLGALSTAIDYSASIQSETTETHIERLAEHLYRISLWITYLVVQFIDRGTFDEKQMHLQERYASLGSTLVSRLFAQPSWRRSLIGYSGFVQTITRLLLRVLDPDLSHLGVPSIISPLSEVFGRLPTSGQSWKSLCAVVLQENPTRTSLAILKPIMRVLVPGQLAHIRSPTALCLIEHFKIMHVCCASSTLVHASLIKHDACRWISTFISRLCHYLPSALEGDSRTSVFSAMLLYLSTDFINLSIASFGHKIIIEVLRHRILSSVLLSFRHLTRHTLTGTSRDPLLTSTISQLEQAFVIFLDNLAAYTTYIKVLRCLGRAMKDMQESGLFTSTYSTPLNDALENLLQSLKNRLDDTQEYGKQLKTANACRNDFCPRGVVCDGSILRCSGCRDALYCSKQCQREDWKHRHRVDCVEIATNKAEQAREYNLDYFLLQGTDKSREDFFRHSILYNEIKRHWIEVSRLLQHRPAPTVVMRADAPILHFYYKDAGRARLQLSTWNQVSPIAGFPKLSKIQARSLMNPQLIPVFGEFPCGDIQGTHYWLEAFSAP
ncbi:hypothetical protein K435DRAFT_972582 [Dendrothele bispora CBS 962.96]|uniref:MYND-type domain-containing protein n=1 Tax=Dendrothele bispora (strain CBS 962.96) TaxID=1314807 RepID=A0A4S8KXX1_DENBC|nr:hypothetical protein K435DRAFT_972582 [Dendrothele bispora CBS 962.96]